MTSKINRKNRSERYIWLDMILTLLTLEVMAYFYYGLHSAALGIVCMTVSFAADFICLRLMHRSFTADDLTVTSDALITALMLPAVFDYTPAAIACAFSVTVAKNLFGGRNNMIFSPAAAAYTFLYTSWKGQILLFQQPHDVAGIFEKTDTLVNSASHSFNLTGKLSYSGFEILMGNFPGPAGAVSILLLMIAALILMFRHDISAGAFIGTISGTVIMAVISPCAGTVTETIRLTLCTNMILFAAVYIIADKRIAPKKEYYAFFYGFFIAAVSYIVVVTTAKENAIVIVSVLFTPLSLALKNLEKKIELAKAEDSAVTGEEAESNVQ